MSIAKPHAGPIGEVKYHHIGTGRTDSIYFCTVCDGWYGVPHDGPFGPHGKGYEHPGAFGCRPVHCACRPCQKVTGRYPSEGTFATHVSLFGKVTP